MGLESQFSRTHLEKSGSDQKSVDHITKIYIYNVHVPVIKSFGKKWICTLKSTSSLSVVVLLLLLLHTLVFFQEKSAINTHNKQTYTECRNSLKAQGDM